MKYNCESCCDMRMDLPATLEAIEEFSARFRDCTRKVLDRKHWFTSELLVREALNNAVLHGCRANPEKRVHCTFRVKNSRLLIVVHDEGDGFDWRSAWNNRAEISATSGRGIELLRTLATRVRFNRRGNAVAVLRLFEYDSRAVPVKVSK